MANFPKMVLTSKGVSLQAKVQGGAQLVLTRMALGDGQLGGTPISGLNALVSQKVNLPLTGGKRVSTQTYQVEAFFSNTTISTGFWWREWGVFATDPDVGEILYCYANAGDAGDYIAPSTDTRIEKYLYASMAVGNASNITVEVSSSDIYITVQELAAHADDTTMHIGTEAKTTPLDADALSLVDSSDGSKLKRLTWANLKAALSSVFAALTHSHSWSEVTSKPSTFNPTGHASSATVYGTGTASLHGHVKLSDATNSTSGAASGATAATPAAVKAAYDLANGKADSSHTHAATAIIQDSTHRFVTDVEKEKACPYELFQSFDTPGTYQLTIPDVYGDGLPYDIGFFLMGGGQSGQSALHYNNTTYLDRVVALGGTCGEIRAFERSVTPGQTVTIVVGSGGIDPGISGAYSGARAAIYSCGNGGSSSFDGVVALGGGSEINNSPLGASSDTMQYTSSQNTNYTVPDKAPFGFEKSRTYSSADGTAYTYNSFPVMSRDNYTNPFDFKTEFGAVGGFAFANRYPNSSVGTTKQLGFSSAVGRAGNGNAQSIAARTAYTATLGGDNATMPGAGGGAYALAVEGTSSGFSMKAGNGGPGLVRLYIRRKPA